MAALLGPIVFVVVVVGGLGSLPGAFIASLLIGLVQTFAVAMDCSLADVFGPLGDLPSTWLADIWNVTIAQIAPIMPYLLLVLILIFRPGACWGRATHERDDLAAPPRRAGDRRQARILRIVGRAPRSRSLLLP